MNQVTSNVLRLVAAAFVLILTQDANAQSRIRYISDIEYQGTLDYVNAGYSLNYAQSHEQTLKQIIEQAREITGFEDQIRSDIYSGLVDALAGKGDLERFLFDIDGPIVVELTGNADGSITAKVGGFSIFADASADIDDYFLDANITISSNTFWLTGDYNIVSGQITNLSPNNFFVSVDVDIDFDLIIDLLIFPVFLAQLAENAIENAAEQGVVQAINNVVAQQEGRVLFNLNDAIPDNKFVFGNYDAGQELRDLAAEHFTDLVSDESFRLTIERIPYYYNAVAPLYPDPNLNPDYTTLTVLYNKHVVTLNISDHFFLEVKDRLHFTVYANNYCSWVYCYVPPDVDLANTPENPTDITIINPDGDTIVIPYGLDFDFESLHLLFEANIPPPLPFSSGEIVASNGSYGYYVHPLCSWQIVTGVSGARDLICDGGLTATQRVVTNYGTYTVVSVYDDANFQMIGSYPNYRISAR